MSNVIKFDHIKRLWYLKNGVVFTRWGNKPVAFSSRVNGRRFAQATINGKSYSILIHEAVFMLFHDRPIAEGKELHHKDGNHENNAVSNLIELTRTQHKRIHKFQCEDPLRGIRLYKGAWQFRWYGKNGRYRARCFQSIDEAMAFRAEIERPRRQELRALGLNCKHVGSGEKTTAIIRSKIYFLRSNAFL